MIKTSLKLAVSVAALAIVSACTPPTANGSVYAPQQTMRAAHVQYGTITSGRYVELRNAPGDQDMIAGAVLGGVLGALAGDQFGKGNGNTLMTGAGAIAGAAAGSNIAKSANRGTAQEWIIKLDSGSSIAVVQNDPSLSIGARVTVVQNGNETRISRSM